MRDSNGPPRGIFETGVAQVRRVRVDEGAGSKIVLP